MEEKGEERPRKEQKRRRSPTPEPEEYEADPEARRRRKAYKTSAAEESDSQGSFEPTYEEAVKELRKRKWTPAQAREFGTASLHHALAETSKQAKKIGLSRKLKKHSLTEVREGYLQQFPELRSGQTGRHAKDTAPQASAKVKSSRK